MYTVKIASLEVNESVNTIGEVQNVVYDIIGMHDLDASEWDWDGSLLEKDNKVIGRISYNGRVWDTEGNELTA